ncbi:MAG: hypothetical protein H0W65_03330 [Sphingomonas sp.]|uniref:hypothetical protein n=1 Tax=Sphingomonas sp. TaxID=28214 RepID=UPI0017E6394C|nr:hypothetical protein [Sphingomonas sp.]MBA3666740.1 hypothetical protein [Sphingomonas sp.]
MARAGREWTMEEYEAWVAAQRKVDKVHAAADERGGPGLSLVPVIEQEIAWPTDLLAPDASPEDGTQPMAAMPIDGVELPESRNRLAGWSAYRQRLFLSTLAETGSVHLASDAARLSARSAYRLRTRSPAFARAWDTALQLSVGRLSAIVFDRAINGRVEQVFNEGVLVAEKRVPSDKLLTWLLARLDPKRFALPWEQRGNADPQAEAVTAFPAQLDDLADVASD